MKILTLSKKGIEEVVEEELLDLSVNERFDLAFKPYRNTRLEHFPKKMMHLPSYSSYCFNRNDKISDIIDICGPFEDVPDFTIVSSEHEKREIIDKERGYLYPKQSQLIVLEKGIYLQELTRYTNGTHRDPVSSMFLDNFLIRSSDSGNENDPVWRACLIQSIGGLLARGYSYSKKIIFGNEKYKNLIEEILEDKGLEKVKLYSLKELI